MTQQHRVLHGSRVWTGARFEELAIRILGEDVVEIAASPAALGAGAAGLDVLRIEEALLPAFVDAHAHPLIGGLELGGLSLRPAETVAEALELVRAHREAHPDAEWILGEGFDLSIDPGGEYFAADLDAVVPDAPVALRSSDIHTFWVNSRALEIAGLSETTPEPRDGVIERDAAGRPSGTLREWGAFMPVYRAIPKHVTGRTAGALLRGLDELRSHGVTAVQDAWVELEDLPAYLEAAESGLPLDLNIAFRIDPDGWREQLPRLEAARERVAAAGVPGFTAQTVKFFADGIIEGGTAHVHEPYTGEGSCCGLPGWSRSALIAAAIEVDRLGFQLHIHAIGDAAVSEAIDAIDAAREANGVRDRRPVIAHAQLIADADYARLRAGDVTLAIQPYWAKLDSVVRTLTNHRLSDERGTRQYPFRTASEHGIRIASSSDFPITTPAPLQAIGLAMSRDADGDPERSWLPDQRLGFAQALAAATAGSAYTRFSETRLGAIAPGMRADLVAVAGLSDAPSAAELLAARVVRSWRRGSERRHPGADPTSSPTAIPQNQ